MAKKKRKIDFYVIAMRKPLEKDGLVLFPIFIGVDDNDKFFYKSTTKNENHLDIHRSKKLSQLAEDLSPDIFLFEGFHKTFVILRKENGNFVEVNAPEILNCFKNLIINDEDYDGEFDLDDDEHVENFISEGKKVKVTVIQCGKEVDSIGNYFDNFIDIVGKSMGNRDFASLIVSNDDGTEGWDVRKDKDGKLTFGIKPDHNIIFPTKILSYFGLVSGCSLRINTDQKIDGKVIVELYGILLNTLENGEFIIQCMSAYDCEIAHNKDNDTHKEVTPEDNVVYCDLDGERIMSWDMDEHLQNKKAIIEFHTIMDFDHPEWKSFIQLMIGIGGKNPKKYKKGGSWDCDGEFTISSRILSEHFQHVSIQDSIHFFKEVGCRCDCEILKFIASQEI